MRKTVTLLTTCVLFLLLAACSPGTSSQVEQAPSLPPYSGPKARLVLGTFDCNAANCFSGVGLGISDAMVTAMVRSNRFQVFEAAENLGVLTQELAVTGDTDAFQGADLAVIGAITQFEPNAGGNDIGGFIPFIGGGVGSSRASATIDLRVVDIKTRNIVTVTRVTGEATSTSVDAGAFLGIAGGSLSQYENTPMETALQKMVYDAVVELGNQIPQSYYQYQ